VGGRGTAEEKTHTASRNNQDGEARLHKELAGKPASVCPMQSKRMPPARKQKRCNGMMSLGFYGKTGFEEKRGHAPDGEFEENAVRTPEPVKKIKDLGKFTDSCSKVKKKYEPRQRPNQKYSAKKRKEDATKSMALHKEGEISTPRATTLKLGITLTVLGALLEKTKNTPPLTRTPVGKKTPGHLPTAKRR